MIIAENHDYIRILYTERDKCAWLSQNTITKEGELYHVSLDHARQQHRFYFSEEILLTLLQGSVHCQHTQEPICNILIFCEWNGG